MFSPEYMYRSFTIATDMANAVCIITVCVAGLGLTLTMYSLIWQFMFNKRRQLNLDLAAELARRPKKQPKVKRVKVPRPASPIVLKPIEEKPEAEFIPDIRSKRQKQKQRKLTSMMREQQEATAVNDDLLLDYEGLAGLEKLAGVNQDAELVISDEGLPTDREVAE